MKKNIKAENLAENLTDIKDFIIQCLEDKKAEDIKVINCTSKTDIAEIMIFATGRSVKNISAIADYIGFELKYKKNISVNIEGMNLSEWVLLDTGNIMLHLFNPESRQYFKLEEIWMEKT